MSQSDEILWSQYEDFCLIGWGAFSKVWRARHRLTGIMVAIKVLEKVDEKFFSIKGEVDILKMTMHPHIVKLFQIVETESNIFLVLELCQNQLMEYVLSKGCLQEEEAHKIFCQILHAISYCHNRGIVHNDIKPDNIMLDDKGMVKIIDFGLAFRFMPGQMITRLCGVCPYMSPEVINGQASDASKHDMWSLGVLLYYMVTGTLPFKCRTHWQLKRKIIRGDYKVPQHLSEDLRNLIRLLLTVNPELRPTAMDVLEHPWLQQDERVSGLCEPLPRQLDPAILTVMKILSFDVSNTLDSIRRCKFDQLMATYLLLQYQAHSKTGDQGQSNLVRPGMTPFPTPTDSDAFPLPPKRKNNVAALWTISSDTKGQGKPEDQQQAERKAGRWASLPGIYLSCQKKRPTVTQDPKRLCPATAPGTPCPNTGPQLPEKKASLPMTEENSEAHSQGTHGKRSRPRLLKSTVSPEMAKEKPSTSTRATLGQGCRPALSGKMASPGSISEEECEPAYQGLRSRWKALQRTIQHGLRRFCSCMRPSQNSRVMPMKARDSSVEHEAPRDLQEQ